MNRFSYLLTGIFFTIFIVIVGSFFLYHRQSWLPKEQIMVRYESAKNELEGIVISRGPRAALDRLTFIATSDTELAGLCHGLSHEVGHIAHMAIGFTQALEVQDDVCGSGYVHGVIETELEDHVEDYETHFTTLCASHDPSCFHGLGHGLMYVTQNNLPKSLQLCSTFSLLFQYIKCAEGVFMENFQADSVVHPSQYLFPEDPYRICHDRPEIEKGVCTFYFPRYYLRIHPEAFSDLFSFCNTLPQQSAVICIKGAGSAAMKLSILEPKKALTTCMLLPQDQRSFCVEGLLSYLIVHYGSTGPARNFCHKNLEPLWSDMCKKSLTEGKRAYSE